MATTGQSTLNYGYDASGDTTSISGGSTNTHLVYDAQGRLSSVTLANGSTIALSYNAEGQRATYTVTPKGAGQPSLSEHFQYRSGQDLRPAQVSVSGTSIPTAYTDTYLYRQDGTPAELIRQQGSTTSDYWYVLDGRGNVVALADSTGHFVDKYQYDLWGAPMSVSESVPQQLRYGSYWYDNELTWYWLSVREYDPVLERFLQPDPSEIEGLFSYAYAQDDPIDYSDPSGFVSCTSTIPAQLVANSGLQTDDGDDGACTSPQSQEDLSGSSPEARLAAKGLVGSVTLDDAGTPLPQCSITVRICYRERTVNGCATGVVARLTGNDVGGDTNVSESIKNTYYQQNGKRVAYDRGHLLGANIGGSNSNPANFVNETVNTNRSSFNRKLEQTVRDLLNAGYGVYYVVTPHYAGSVFDQHPGEGQLCTPEYLTVIIGRTATPIDPLAKDFPLYAGPGEGIICPVSGSVVPNTTPSEVIPDPLLLLNGEESNATLPECKEPLVGPPPPPPDVA